ncbi:hypothetical protein G9A89_011281 [Geosiphon pyriformis]|nr:hypothetical protein G9A89_011281 [Geosiphon pyriformis]
MYLVDLPTVVTYAKDFEAAELEANHAQAVNLVMNSHGSKKCVSVTTVVNKDTLEPTAECTGSTQNLNLQHYLSLLVIPEDVISNNPEPNQPTTLTNNILPATITDNESLAIIFLFELKEITTVPLFSGAALEEKPITVMYTDAKVDGQYIKLILDSESADSIITKQLMDQLGHQIDRAVSTKIITANGIIVPIKVLVMKAT